MFEETASSTTLVEDMSLVVVGGPHQGLKLRLDDEFIRIGRADWCDLSLPDDAGVSFQHCECFIDKRGFRVRDLKSRNGTWLHDCPVLETYLVEGSIIRVGESTIQLQSHNRQKELVLEHQDVSGLLVGQSPEMHRLFSMLSRLAKRDIITLLTGETGTGKTTVAQAIHQQSHRSNAPFVVVNCGALPASLVEASLFGYEKGAFTGASSQHQGFFQQAHRGTLFLDEIAELPLDLQPKLLDVLESKKVRRLGSESEVDVDFRLIAASHRNLASEVEQGRFREDLYYRLSVIELEVPPLRDRIEDLPLLMTRLLMKLAPEQQLHVTEEAIEELSHYLWPGNIRELRNTLDRSLTFLDGDTIDVSDLHLPKGGRRTKARASKQAESSADDALMGSIVPCVENLSLFFHSPLNEYPLALKDFLVEAEKVIIQKALSETGDSVSQASTQLGITRAWLYNRIHKHNLKE